MKTIEELKPNYSPVYAALYPAFAKIFQKHGYALSIHGSMARDFDVIAIPWAEKVSEPQIVIDDITSHFDVQQIREPGKKNWGRIAYTISIGHGSCALDLSFFPDVSPEKRGE